MSEQIKEKLKGINAINITPFNEHNDIDWNLLNKNIDFLIDNGIEVIYPCGNTGEFYSLCLDEAKKVTRSVIKHVNGRALVIAGVGYDVKTATELTKNAETMGADGIMIHQPVNPFILGEGIIKYYKQIADSTSLPIILYVKNESMTVDVLNEAAKIRNVIGIKYAVNNLPSFSTAVQTIKEDIVWICGTAEMWAPFFFAAGAEGFTSGLVNVETKRSKKLLQALKENNYDQAMTIWNELRPFEELRARHRDGNNVSVVKEAMYQLGLSNGIVREPIASLSIEEKKELTDILKLWQLIKIAD